MGRSGFVLLIFAATLAAQSTGEVTGTVTDPSGAAVGGAALRLTNDATGVALPGRANEAGLFRFTALTPGSYTLVAEQPGFSPARVTGIAVEVNRISRVDAVLSVAATQQEVTVSASAQLLDVDNGTKGYTVGVAQMRSLPLQSRSPLALMTLTPGVFVGTATAGTSTTIRQASDGTIASSGYSINGGARTSTGGFQEFIVDGISVTNQRDGGVSALPSADALQEFRVQSGGMSPEYGRTVGGVVNYVTASGTNQFHGSLFESNRNTATTARRALPAVGEKPINNFNQFGGTIGGPVLIPRIYNGRNRTFFFFSYDGSRWLRNNPTNDTVPTVRMRNGDFGEVSQRVYDPASAAAAAQRTPFPNNAVPQSRFNRYGKNILDTFPLPSRAGVAGNYAGRFRVLTPVDNYTGRVDQQLTDNHRLMGRLTWVNSINNQGWNLGENDGRFGVSDLPTRNLTFNYNYTVRPDLLYSAAFGYTKFHRTFLDPSGNTAGASFFGYAVNPAPPLRQQNIRPAANFDIYRSVGSITTEDQLAESYQVNQSLSYIRGKHTFRFGADVRRYSAGGLLTVGAPNGSFTFNPLQTSQGTAQTGHSAASALLGLPNAAFFAQPPQLAVAKYTPAIFVQDDFRVSSRLTVNIGLRIDREGGLSESGNRVGFFDPDTSHPTVGRAGVFRYAGDGGAPGTITQSQWNWSPRIGLAYAAGSARRTVVRGAFGSYVGPVPTDGYFGAALGYEPTLDFVRAAATDPAVVLRDSYTLSPALGPLGAEAYLGQSVTQPFNREPLPSRVHQWNFGVQREVARNLVLDVLYTGNRGMRLIAGRNVNLPDEAVINDAIRRTASTGLPAAAQTYLNERIPNPLAGRVPGTLGAATVTRTQAAARYPHYSGVSAWLNDRDAIYHALQTTLQKRLSQDVNFLVAYTWGKSINNYGNQQNPYDTRDARGASTIDRLHMFSANAVWQLPFGKGKAWANSGVAAAVLGGFQLNGIVHVQGGVPVSVTQSASNGLGVGTSRPDVIADPATLSKRVRGQVASNGNVRWIDGAAYAIVNGRYGSMPASDSRLRTPGYFQTDLGLMRDFRLVENLIVRFRAEAFNAFNHTNYAAPVTNINSPTFGEISGVSDPRIFQFGLEVKF